MKGNDADANKAKNDAGIEVNGAAGSIGVFTPSVPGDGDDIAVLIPGSNHQHHGTDKDKDDDSIPITPLIYIKSTEKDIEWQKPEMGTMKDAIYHYGTIQREGKDKNDPYNMRVAIGQGEKDQVFLNEEDIKRIQGLIKTHNDKNPDDPRLFSYEFKDKKGQVYGSLEITSDGVKVTQDDYVQKHGFSCFGQDFSKLNKEMGVGTNVEVSQEVEGPSHGVEVLTGIGPGVKVFTNEEARKILEEEKEKKHQESKAKIEEFFKKYSKSFIKDKEDEKVINHLASIIAGKKFHAAALPAGDDFALVLRSEASSQINDLKEMERSNNKGQKQTAKKLHAYKIEINKASMMVTITSHESGKSGDQVIQLGVFDGEKEKLLDAFKGLKTEIVPDFKKLWPNAEHASPYVSPTASPGNSAKVNSLGTPPTPNS